MWEQVANLLAQYGVWGLVLLAFAESSFFPLAPDFLLVPLSLAQPQRALWFAVLSVLASVAGAYCGYLLGRTLGQPLLRRMANPLTLRRMEEAMDRYGAWAVLLAALVPLPFKLFTISSGCLAMNVPRFLLAAFIGRGVRFTAEAAIIMAMGAQAISFLSRDFLWLSLGLAVAIVALYLLYLLVKRRRRSRGRKAYRPALPRPERAGTVTPSDTSP